MKIEALIMLVYLLYLDPCLCLKYDSGIGTRNVSPIFNCARLKT